MKSILSTHYTLENWLGQGKGSCSLVSCHFQKVMREISNFQYSIWENAIYRSHQATSRGFPRGFNSDGPYEQMWKKNNLTIIWKMMFTEINALEVASKLHIHLTKITVQCFFRENEIEYCVFFLDYNTKYWKNIALGKIDAGGDAKLQLHFPWPNWLTDQEPLYILKPKLERHLLFFFQQDWLRLIGPT